MRAAHGMARHRRQSPEGERRAASFRRNGERRGPAFPSEQGSPRRIFPLHRFLPPQQGRPLFAGRGRALALHSIFFEKNTAFC